MNGRYLFGLPFIDIRVELHEIEALVDTGFKGSLLLPAALLKEMSLTKSGIMNCVLADGRRARIPVFNTQIDFFGRRAIQILAGDNALPLIGMQLLCHTRTVIDPQSNLVDLTASQNA